MDKNFLSIEEQFAETLNDDQIERIEDTELKSIRRKHWEYQTKIFLDKNRITDKELCELSDVDFQKEKEELEDYKKRYNL